MPLFGFVKRDQDFESNWVPNLNKITMSLKQALVVFLQYYALLHWMVEFLIYHRKTVPLADHGSSC